MYRNYHSQIESCQNSNLAPLIPNSSEAILATCKHQRSTQRTTVQVLSIGETVEEVSDSGFLGPVPTLQVQLLVDDSLLQVIYSWMAISTNQHLVPVQGNAVFHFFGSLNVFRLQIHPGGLRHIRSDRRINEWRAPGRKVIVRAATNERQVVIAMSGGEIIYFELAAAGTLMETEKKEIGADIISLDVAPVSAGRQRSRFLAIGTSTSTVCSMNAIWLYTTAAAS